MSQENVELVLAGYRHWAAGDMDAVRSLVDPELVWRPALGAAMLGATEYRGWDGLMAYRREVEATLDEFRAEPVEVVLDKGEQVIVESRASGVGLASHAPFEHRVWHLWTVRDGRIARLETFTEEAAARRVAAGEE